MKVKLNPDQQVVSIIRERLMRTGGHCSCRLECTEATNVWGRSLRIRLQIQAIKAFAIVCFITNLCRIKGGIL